MSVTAVSDGITTRGSAALCPTPIATLPTVLMADGVACDRRNYPRTLETSGHLVRRGTSARIGLGEPARANCHRTLALLTDRADVVAQANYQRTPAPTGRAADNGLDREDQLAASLQAVSGADPEGIRVTGEALSQEAVPRGLISSAIAEPAAWEAVASGAEVVFEEAVASGAVVVAAVVVAGAGGDHLRKTNETKEHNQGTPCAFRQCHPGCWL
jgi:hypothetical protein